MTLLLGQGSFLSPALLLRQPGGLGEGVGLLRGVVVGGLGDGEGREVEQGHRQVEEVKDRRLAQGRENAFFSGSFDTCISAVLR